MEDPPNEPTEQDSTSGQEAIDQDAIDALVKGAAGDDASSDESADAQPVDAPQEESQASPAADGASDAGPKKSDTFNQADIDALLQASGSDDQDTSTTQSGGGDAPSEQPVRESTEQEPSDARVDTQGRPFDEAAAAMQAAMDEERESAPAVAAAPPTPGVQPDTQAVSLPTFSEESDLDINAKRVTMLNDVKLRVKIELGRTRMLVEDVLKLSEGSVVELDKLAGDPVDVYVNDRLVARGEVLVLNDNFCVRISDVMSRDPHRISA